MRKIGMEKKLFFMCFLFYPSTFAMQLPLSAGSSQSSFEPLMDDYVVRFCTEFKNMRGNTTQARDFLHSDDPRLYKVNKSELQEWRQHFATRDNQLREWLMAKKWFEKQQDIGTIFGITGAVSLVIGNTCTGYCSDLERCINVGTIFLITAGILKGLDFYQSKKKEQVIVTAICDRIAFLYQNKILREKDAQIREKETQIKQLKKRLEAKDETHSVE